MKVGEVVMETPTDDDQVEWVEPEPKNLAKNCEHLSYDPWATVFDQKTRGTRDIWVGLQNYFLIDVVQYGR